MKRITVTLLAIIVVVGMLTACAGKPASTEYDAYSAAQAERGVFGGQSAAPAAEAPRAPSQPAANADAASGEIPETRLIIRTVNMRIVVQDTDATLLAIRQMVAAYDGYVADSNRWLVGEQPWARVTLRIPAEQLDQALDSLRSAAIRVDNESSSGQDVTEEYVDIDARLRNLEATEQELLQLLTEVRENRGTAEDVLAIHREITSIRSQIESLQGRKNYLSRMATLATINVEITPKDQPVSVVQRANWNPLVTASNALRSFVQVFQTLADALIYLLLFSPLMLAPILVLWLIVRAIRKRQVKRANSA
jgi:hypothetical protein